MNAIYITILSSFFPKVHHHGAMSPIKSYPTNINKAKWPDGFQWLTNRGKKQMYAVGKYLRKRYREFLNVKRYNHNEIVVESSELSWCIMSVESCLAALFRPTKDNVWMRGLRWQPVPVLTQNYLSLSKDCPRYQLLNMRYMMGLFNMINTTFIKMIEEKCGCNITSMSDFVLLGNTLRCENEHRYAWSPWVGEVWDEIYEIMTERNIAYTATKEMTRLKGGPLLNKILANIKNAIIDAKEKKENDDMSGNIGPKMYLYSGHDLTIYALFSAMNIEFREMLPYAAVVMVELHKIDDDYVIKAFYKNKSHRETYELQPVGCPLSGCTFENFKKITAEVIPGDWNSECRSSLMYVDNYKLREYISGRRQYLFNASFIN